MNLFEFRLALLETGTSSVEFAANWLLQSTLLIACGLIVGRLLRQHGSAVQSMVYRTTLVAVLLCPLATWGFAQAGLTGWSVALPDSYRSVEVKGTATESAEADTASLNNVDSGSPPGPSIAELPISETMPSPTAELTVIPATAELVVSEQFEPSAAAQHHESHELALSALPESSKRLLAVQGLSGLLLGLATLWFFVSCGLMLRLAVSCWKMSWLKRRAICADENTTAICGRLASLLDVSQPELLRSPYLPSPCLTGIRRPAILLPEDGQQLSLREVLVHELAHLKRRDCHWNLLRQVATALLFFQPLLWRLSRELERTAEEVCDDFVVELGGDRRDYARRLLNIAELSLAPVAHAGVGIVSLRSMLASRVVRILDTSRALSTRVGNLMFVLVLTSGLTGAAVAGFLGLDPQTSQAEVDEADASNPPAEIASAETDASHATKTIRGRVLLPDGSPAVGATVSVGLPDFSMYGSNNSGIRVAKPIRTDVDSDGAFEITYSRCDLFETPDLVPDSLWNRVDLMAFVAAHAKGYGPAWVKGHEQDTPRSLRLVKDHPIEGRLVSIDGTPVADARLRVVSVMAVPDENLQPWIDALADSKNIYQLNHEHHFQSLWPNLMGDTGEVITDRQGRFRIDNIGKDRVVRVLAAGPKIGRSFYWIAGREMKPVKTQFSRVRKEGVVYGAIAESIVVGPSRPIEGTVRDADTGQPLAGVTIEQYQLAGFLMGDYEWALRATTDKNGKFHLDGMPKGASNRFLAVPGDDLPYLIREIPIPDKGGLGAINVDVELHRGIWIKGKVVDKSTGKPVQAKLTYLPFLNNEFALKLPEFSNGTIDGGLGRQMPWTTRPDGSFRMVGLPGRAIVGALATGDAGAEYLKGAGSDRIEGMNENGLFETFRAPAPASNRFFHGLAEVSPPADAESVTVKLEMERATPIQIRVTDSKGKPVSGYRFGHNLRWSDLQSNPEFEVLGLAPDQERTIFILHEQRRLANTVHIDSDVDRQQVQIVQLQPCGTIRGQLVDDQGEPLAKVKLQVGSLEHGFKTDEEGRFEFEMVPPGKYWLKPYGAAYFKTDRSLEIDVEPGETVNLKRLRVGKGQLLEREGDDDTSALLEPKANHRAAAKAAIIRGTVTGPDGKPLRAQIWIGGPPRTDGWSRRPQSVKWTRQSQTGDDGRFELSLDHNGSANNRPKMIRIAATADGLGFAWADVKVAKPQGDISLQLVKDMPIEGRILTADGQPAAGVDLSIVAINSTNLPKITVEGILKNAPLSSGVYTNWPNRPGGSPTSKPVVTDADGRFRLAGLGVNRFVRLEAIGGGIGATRLGIHTRATPPKAEPHGIIAVREGLSESTYFAKFTHIAAPGRTLQGVVTDARTGEPVSGVRMVVYSSWASRKTPTVTGADGRYQITGIPKAADYRLNLEPAKSLHFNQQLKIADPTGLGPIVTDISLVEGIRVRGRVTDAESGEPVSGTVIYNPLYPNQHVSRLGKQNQIANPASSAIVNGDGSFEISVLPGPGAIAARIEGNTFVSARVDADKLKAIVGKAARIKDGEEIRSLQTAAGAQSRGLMGLTHHQAAALIKPAEHSKDMTVNLSVFPSRSRPGTIVDQRGKPLAGVEVIGLGPSWASMTRRPLETAEFKIDGLVAGRTRTLLFFHRERNLGAKVVVSGDEMDPVSVKLSPTGTIVGRIVDTKGEPFQTSHIRMTPADPPLSGSGFWTTNIDDDGRFRVTGLINGCLYRLDAQIPEQRVALYVTHDVKVASGETKDIGEFKQKNEYQFMPVEVADSDE